MDVEEENTYFRAFRFSSKNSHADTALLEVPGEYNDQGQKFWSNYVAEAHKYDTNMLESWKDNTDSTLIFVSRGL